MPALMTVRRVSTAARGPPPVARSVATRRKEPSRSSRSGEPFVPFAFSSFVPAKLRRARAPPRTRPSRRTPRPERRPRDTSRVTDRRPRIPRASNVFCDGSVPPPRPRPFTRAANALKKQNKSQENEPTTPRRVRKTPPRGACTSASAPCLTRRASAKFRSRRFPSAFAGSIRAKIAKTARRRR